MPSPFPGMDPYLEAHWGDVHTSLVTYARNQLRGQLPADLKARIDEYLAVESDDPDEPDRGYFSDVRVVERAEVSSRVPEASSAVVAEPVIVPTRPEPRTLRSLRIIDRSAGDRIVTTIEFLSPANKTGRGLERFREKQESLLAGGANLVEIDLIRKGRWALTASVRMVPASCRGPYRVCVVRAEREHESEVYRVPLNAPLPMIRIPLRDTDPDASLDLQALVGAAWEDGDYADLDYSAEPAPPLSADEAAWANALLRNAGRRN